MHLVIMSCKWVSKDVLWVSYSSSFLPLHDGYMHVGLTSLHASVPYYVRHVLFQMSFCGSTFTDAASAVPGAVAPARAKASALARPIP